jgi:hypothetical protein
MAAFKGRIHGCTRTLRRYVRFLLHRGRRPYMAEQTHRDSPRGRPIDFTKQSHRENMSKYNDMFISPASLPGIDRAPRPRPRQQARPGDRPRAYCARPALRHDLPATATAATSGLDGCDLHIPARQVILRNKPTESIPRVPLLDARRIARFHEADRSGGHPCSREGLRCSGEPGSSTRRPEIAA